MAEMGEKRRAARRLLCAADVDAIDSAMETAGVSGVDLMARAGEAIGDRALTAFPVARRIEVWCGPGKNGGDGWVAARRLLEGGRAATVRSLAPVERLTGDARVAFERYASIGGSWASLDAAAASDEAAPDLIIDALFGVGLSRPLDGAAAEAARRTETPGAPPALAVDMPSGISADTGAALGPAVRATETITFVAPKRGHFLREGAVATGALIVIDILAGEPARAAALSMASDDVFEIAPNTFWQDAAVGGLDKGTAAPLGHKYSYGHALTIAGGFGATGAARLAGRSALRVGAGLSTIVAPPEAMAECAAHLTAAMLRPAETPAEIAAMLEDRRINAVVLGPGHAAHPGGSGRTRDVALAVLAAAVDRERPCALVFDADALSCWGDAPESLFAACRRMGRSVLTPHLGEFARLFPDLATRLADSAASTYGKIEAARDAAARAGAVVLLKGVDTVVAAPDGRVAVHAAVRDRTAPWLATAGAGDVLAGAIGGLCARGFAPFDAALASVWLHVEAARRFGPGAIAEDLVEQLPGALAAAIAAGA